VWPCRYIGFGRPLSHSRAKSCKVQLAWFSGHAGKWWRRRTPTRALKQALTGANDLGTRPVRFWPYKTACYQCRFCARHSACLSHHGRLKPSCRTGGQSCTRVNSREVRHLPYIPLLSRPLTFIVTVASVPWYGRLSRWSAVTDPTQYLGILSAWLLGGISIVQFCRHIPPTVSIRNDADHLYRHIRQDLPQWPASNPINQWVCPQSNPSLSSPFAG